MIMMIIYSAMIIVSGIAFAKAVYEIDKYEQMGRHKSMVDLIKTCKVEIFIALVFLMNIMMGLSFLINGQTFFNSLVLVTSPFACMVEIIYNQKGDPLIMRKLIIGHSIMTTLGVIYVISFLVEG